MFIDEKEGRIKVYDSDNELVLELGTIGTTDDGNTLYGLTLYKASSIFVGEEGTIKLGDNLTIYNNRIVLNDGVNDRMLIGYQENGF